jgi:hypothetical protein
VVTAWFLTNLLLLQSRLQRRKPKSLNRVGNKLKINIMKKKHRVLITIMLVIRTVALVAQNPLMFNTATNSSYTGVIGLNLPDNSWRVDNNIAGLFTTQPVRCAVVTGWNIPPLNADWITYPHNCTPGVPSNHGCNNPVVSDEYYRIDFTLSSLNYYLELDIWGDNCVKEVYLNSTTTPYWTSPITSPFDQTYYGFATANVTNVKFCNGWALGNNYIIIRVVSYGGVNPDYTGLLVVAKPQIPIIGNTNICSGSTTTYSTAPIAGATSYVWTLPMGWSGTSNTNTISPIVGSSSGIVQVAITTTCGIITRTLNVSTAINLTTNNYTWCTNASTSIAISANSNYTGGPITFNWQPGNLTGQTINVTPTVTTIYTVSASSPSACPSSATLAVTVTTNCCSQSTTGLTQLTSLNGVYANTSYFLSNNITLTASSNIRDAEVKIMPGVQITIPAGMVLTLDHVHLYACGINMWQGIVVQDGGQILTSSASKLTSLIEDAVVGIDVIGITPAYANPPVNISMVIFNKNYTGLRFGNAQAAVTTVPISLKECVFTSRTMPFTSPAPFNASSWPNASNTVGGLRFASSPTTGIGPPYALLSYVVSNLKAPYASQSAYSGIRIENMGHLAGAATAAGLDMGITYPSTIPQFNLFDNLQIGIDVQDASLTTMNNVFQNSLQGISHSVSGLMNARLNLAPTSTTTSLGNRFWNCWRGVTTGNVFEVNITYGIYRSTRNTGTGNGVGMAAITLQSNRFLYNIQKSEFNNLDNGIIANAYAGNYDIGAGSVFGTYGANMAIIQNYFGPQVTSTTVVTPGSQYLGFAITISGVSASNWAVAGAGKILSNKINRAYRGIRSNTMRTYPIEIGGNTILIFDDSFVQPTGDQYGIWANNSTANLIINLNHVNGQGIANNRLKLIRSVSNSGAGSPRVTCNQVADGYIGFEFSGAQPNTVWQGNSMLQKMFRGLALVNGGAIGIQGSTSLSSANVWSNNGNISPNIWAIRAQTYVDASSNAFPGSFLYCKTGVLTLPTTNASGGGIPFQLGGGQPSLFSNATTVASYTCANPYLPTPSQRLLELNETGFEDNVNVNTEWNAEVFPNPSNGSLNIKTSNGDENLSVRILDVNGNLVYTQDLTNASSASIDVSGLKAAIYFVEIQNSDGKLVRKKLIKLD